jgi:hypothetical protein
VSASDKFSEMWFLAQYSRLTIVEEMCRKGTKSLEDVNGLLSNDLALFTRRQLECGTRLHFPVNAVASVTVH